MPKSLKKTVSLFMAMLLILGIVLPISLKAAASTDIGGMPEVTDQTIYFGNFIQGDAGINVPTNGRPFARAIVEKSNLNLPNNLMYYYFEPIAWKVVDNGNDGLLLLSDKVLEFKEFSNIPSGWNSSTIREWLNGYFLSGYTYIDPISSIDLSVPEAFGAVEKEALADIVGDGDKVFLLSVEEANKLTQADRIASTGTDYKITKKLAADSISTPEPWMLRDSGNIAGSKAVVGVDGAINTAGTPPNARSGIRPAIKLEADKIVLFSDANSAKSTATPGTLELQSSLPNEIKPTVITSSISFSATLNSTTLAAQNTDVVIPYTASGTYDHISAVLVDNTGKVTHYGELDTTTSLGNATIKTPAADGEYTLKVFAEKLNAPKMADFASIPAVTKLTVSGAAPAAPLFTTTTLPDATQNVVYSQAIVATGNPAPAITLKAGSTLPAGLSLVNGELVGTPTGNGSFTFTLTATNASGLAGADATVDQTFILNVAATEAATITTPTGALPAALTGQSYSTIITATGIPAPTFAVVGSLPSGLSLNATTGEISGTPTAFNNYSFAIKANNTYGDSTVNFTLDVQDPTTPVTPVITNLSSLDGVEGTTHTVTFEATGYPTPSLNMTSSPPTGCTFIDNGDGTATFTVPSTVAPQSINLIIYASNAAGNVTTTFPVRIISASAATAPIIGAATLAEGTINTAYSADVNAVGTPSPTVTATGLPAGLTMSATGQITGTPSVSGAFNVTVTAINGVIPDATQNYVLTINPSTVPPVNTAPTIVTASLVAGVEGNAYTELIVTTGNPQPTVGVNGLPAGLSFNPTTGVISGTPTVNGTFTVDISASNAAGNAARSISLTIAPSGGTTVPPNPPTGKEPTVTYSPNPMTLDTYASPRRGSIAVNLGSSGAVEAEIVASSNAVRVSPAKLTANGTIDVVAANAGLTTITINFKDANGLIISGYTQTIPVVVVDSKDYTREPGRGGGSGGGGGGGGGYRAPVIASSTTTKAPPVVSQTTLWENFMKKIPTSVKAANDKSLDFAGISIQNADILTVARAKQIVADAQKNGGKVAVLADNTVGNAIKVRMTVHADKVDRDIKLGGTVNGSSIESFKKHYSNNIQGVSFTHQDDAGQSVHVAAKLDLTGVNTKNLVFYTYNSTTGKYTKLAKPNYWMDKNGYLHFDTTVLNHIIVSEGALVKK